MVGPGPADETQVEVVFHVKGSDFQKTLQQKQVSKEIPQNTDCVQNQKREMAENYITMAGVT